MILIMAACGGAATVRWQFPDPHAWFAEQVRFGESWYGTATMIEAGAWVLLSSTLAWVVLRLRGPRVFRQKLFAQPGVQAALAMGLALPLWDFQHAGENHPEDWEARDLVSLLESYDGIGGALAQTTGPTLAAIWVATALAGRRRAEPHWVDRAGRGLGWSWIALWLANGLYLVIQGHSKK